MTVSARSVPNHKIQNRMNEKEKAALRAKLASLSNEPVQQAILDVLEALIEAAPETATATETAPDAPAKAAKKKA